MDSGELQRYMYERIPLSQAMAVQVVDATAEAVVLRAPLAPNINHRQTVFGGSASAIALLAGWAVLFLRLRHEGLDGYIVVRRNTMSYERPIDGDFTATAAMNDAAAWSEFATTLKRKQRARITLSVVLHYRGDAAGRLEAEFVVVAPAAGKADPA